MKALFYEGNHTLTIGEAKQPVAGKGEALIRVAYTGICGTDMLIWHDGLARVKPPVILGHEFSGTIVQLGDANSSFGIGDRVVVEPLLTCGTCSACASGHYNVCTRSFQLIGIDTDGGMAGYVKAPIDKLFRIPAGVSLEGAAFVEPLAVGVHMVRQSGVKPGQTALVVGGGPIGLIAAKVAALQGANVWISEIHPFRIEKAKELGFRVVNPQEENIAEKMQAVSGGHGAHVAFEATGTNFGLSDCISAAGPHGRIVVAGLPRKPPVIDAYQIVAKELALAGSRVYRSEDYTDALRLLETGQFVPADYISRIVPLENAIRDGFEAIDRGDPVIKILIRMDNEGEA
ncbi:hypothetical protein SD70_05805 [Gordoniibacillus kamchatkensis]|uniref:Enoyl reductase (ER) domain-containing protein n=1 Tax=Gordoniibacillus kamchatkensis TaxID=1590651 RepID=A0ABR5AMQ3_9BACL|nr:alcohol dehydrogenase catalytic domain-containing protein [Paenibacillus sp. VKM B-2647]KIL41637.1 hypothetical protein SD70_05805 [Paenibacillus sp. VKM B-2647]